MPRYVERLEFELGTILKMGFPGYFLIVGDFINWAKNNGCPVGPGRGSGAGSLVAYALKITDLDPLPLQPAVRALPEPRAGVHARLRHRLLPDQPQPGDRLRQGKIRQGCREPDCHLRHHGRARRHPRRGPRDGHELHLLRWHQQAHSQNPAPTYTCNYPPTDGKKDDKYNYASEAGARVVRARAQGRRRQNRASRWRKSSKA
jgi:DNA polymerase-3 subunit alpha